MLLSVAVCGIALNSFLAMPSKIKNNASQYIFVVCCSVAKYFAVSCSLEQFLALYCSVMQCVELIFGNAKQKNEDCQ